MTLHFASPIFERPPRIICSRISGSPLSGKPTMDSAETGLPPMAYTSLSEFAAAICPNVNGSSTIGVKKSTVCTSAISGLSRYTPASSLVSKPTSTFGSVGRGKRRKTESSNPGLSFAAQPAALTMAVSFTVGVKPHLAVRRFDYSEVPHFVLVHRKTFGHLRDVREKCSHSRMPWDIWLIFFVLGVILPWRGRVRTKKLLALPHVSTTERLVLYASTIAFQWLAVAVVTWRAWAHGFTVSQLGLTIHGRSRILLAAIVGTLAIAALQWLNLRRVGRIPVEARGSLQALAERILPQSTVELLPYLALAITAGLCEEFLYRGFAMAVLVHVGLQAWAVVLISSVLFGLAHSYQGRGGIAMTLVIGTILGTSRIAYDSLVPAIFWHSAVDVVAGTAGPHYLAPKGSGDEKRGDLATKVN